MATTQVQYTISGPTDKTHAYGSIEMPPDGLSIVDSDLLVVSINGSTLTLNTDYTVDTGNEDIIIDAGYTVATNDVLVINRSTSIETPYVDFTNNTAVDAEEVDLALLQLRFRLQELDTTLNDLIEYDASSLHWDGKDRKTGNFMPATSGDGLTTLAQVQSLVAGVDIATVSETYSAKASGDGATTVFGLSGFPTTDLSDASIMVTIDGVMQYPGGSFDYTYALSGSTPTVTFTTAPPTGTNNILFRVFKGTVQAAYEDATIDGDALITGSVPVSKIEAAAGDNNRVIFFNSSGIAALDTIVHTDITDFDAGVQANRTNELTAPNGPVGFNNQKLINLGTGATGTSDACTVAQMEAYADAAAAGVAGTEAFMEPYDTDSSAEYTDPAGTTQTVTGLTAGTYVVFVSLQDSAAPSSITVNGVTRAGRGFSQTLPFIVSVTNTITVTCGGTDTIRNLTGFRLS